MTATDDRAAAVAWARALLVDDFVVLDTETTGLHSDAEIVQIAVIDKTGAPLLETLIKPTQPIPSGATRIHGITDAKVADAPTFGQIYDTLLMAVGGKRCVIYNADYDTRLLHQSEQWYQQRIDSTWDCSEMDGWRLMAVWECAMLQYAAFVGETSKYHGTYRYQRLPGGDHSALSDCHACLALIKRMAGVPNATITIPVMDAELRGYDAHYGSIYLEGRYNDPYDTPLADLLSAFVADLVAAYTDRAGSEERQALSHAYLDRWRRDQGWKPAYERIREGKTE